MKYIIYLFAFALIISCSDSSEPETPQWVTLGFNVDENYLAAEIEDPELGISYRPIINFEEIPQINSSLQASEGDFVQIHKLFKDPETQSIMSVNSIATMPDSLIYGLLENPSLYFNQDGIYSTAIASSFTFKEFKVIQLLLSNDAVINFKLFFIEGGKEKFQLDYIFQSQLFEEFPVALESSVGSTKPI